ncbi:helix-turn-helix transcriptional regulator [Listeria ilorinensis]|uniref:helix-turn-helix transcriptional regulator n=1 Tax=Listeria ilorinensis TaxID=2867439 RepID=UPI001EF7150B|nr:helix-turn-helix transcriptional regulator [Listeria ilorinensis]
MKISNRLKELRESRHLSQGDLAQTMEVSRQTINAIERGKYNPSLELTFKIALYFQTNIEDIFYPEVNGK